MHFNFPHNFVYWKEVENHSKWKEKYLTTIQEISAEWGSHPHFYSDFKSSFNDFDDTNINHIMMHDKDFISDVIWNPFDTMIQEEFFIFDKPYQSMVHELWFNLYEPGQFQEVHDHNGFFYKENKTYYANNYSGIYILQSDEPNKTVFYQPGPNPGAKVSGAANYKTEHLQEGMVIIFPSNLLHYVMPCEKPRATVAFNLVSMYDM